MYVAVCSKYVSKFTLLSFWQALRRHGGRLKRQETQSWASQRPTEVITIEGEEHLVPQRYEHSRAIDFASASFYVSKSCSACDGTLRTDIH